MDTENSSYADREKEREARAAERIDRYTVYAENAARRSASASAYNRSDDLSARFAGGQPILSGHHSEKRARRDRDQSDAAMRRGIEDAKKVGYWERRTEGVARRAAQRTDPHVTARRIGRLEAEERELVRLLERAQDEGYRAQLTDRAGAVAEQLAYWRAHLAESGVKLYDRSDFTKGDFALSRGTWWEIKRVNQKTITVESIIGSASRKVYRLSDNPYGWTDTIPYTEIEGRKAAAEMDAM